MSSRDFYPPEFTARSRAVLDEVCAAVPNAVLIGGWGTWVRTQGPMSHDIDLILTRAELVALDPQVEGMSDSRHLGGRKWRASLREIHLDLYVPFESTLGQRLGLKVEVLAPLRETVRRWNVLQLPAHISTKFAALLDRPESLPGQKDRHEIVDLLQLGVDPTAATSVLREASSRELDEVAAMVEEAFEYLQDLDLDRKRRRRLREIGAQWQAALDSDALADDDPATGTGGDERPPNEGAAEQVRLTKDDALVRGRDTHRPGTKGTCGVWIKSAGAPCVLKPKHRGNHRSRT